MDLLEIKKNMFRLITGHHRFHLKSYAVRVYIQLLQTRIGVEISSPTCL